MANERLENERLEGIIGAFSTQQDAEFARRALTEIGRFDGNLVSVMVNDAQDRVDRFFVILNDNPPTVAQAKTFLKGSMPQMRTEQDLRYEASQSAERVKRMPFMGGTSL